MLNFLQLAAGASPRSKEFVDNERLAKFFGQKNLKELAKG
jgi:hypothetical protein